MKVSKVTVKSYKRSPKAPFTTDTLLQTAGSRYSWKPSNTMRLAQGLYEAGHITYMRTDSTTYSKEFLDTMSTFIESKYDKRYVREDIGNLVLRRNDGAAKKTKGSGSKTQKGQGGSKIVQEAHEAIRPTDCTNEHI